MKSIMRRWGNSALIVSLAVLLGFNTYYFFIRREVGLSFYLKKVFEKPVDPILTHSLYKETTGLNTNTLIALIKVLSISFSWETALRLASKQTNISHTRNY